MRKFENFCKALDTLQDIFDYEAPYGNVEMTGREGLHREVASLFGFVISQSD